MFLVVLDMPDKDMSLDTNAGLLMQMEKQTNPQGKDRVEVINRQWSVKELEEAGKLDKLNKQSLLNSKDWGMWLDSTNTLP